MPASATTPRTRRVVVAAVEVQRFAVGEQSSLGDGVESGFDGGHPCGARVINSVAGPGKGQALRGALAAAHGEVLVFLDADVANFGAHFLIGLLGPLLLRPDIGFVKGFYCRPFEGRVGEGGRVIELLARPLLARLFPIWPASSSPWPGSAQPVATCSRPRRPSGTRETVP
jgi:cellulose synthase/poly-beta-1,6-N-acetylglucosamine synthase-like glycosyltransferase